MSERTLQNLGIFISSYINIIKELEYLAVPIQINFSSFYETLGLRKQFFDTGHDRSKKIRNIAKILFITYSFQNGTSHFLVLSFIFALNALVGTLRGAGFYPLFCVVGETFLVRTELG
jgi:hypothetical protein